MVDLVQILFHSTTACSFFIFLLLFMCTWFCELTISLIQIIRQTHTPNRRRVQWRITRGHENIILIFILQGIGDSSGFRSLTLLCFIFSLDRHRMWGLVFIHLAFILFFVTILCLHPFLILGLYHHILSSWTFQHYINHAATKQRISSIISG